MRKILRALRDHAREDFHAGWYGLTLVFLVVMIGVNYRYDFEDSIIDAYIGQKIRYLWYFLFYGVAYYFTVAAYVLTTRDTGYVRQRRFWVLSLAGVGILAVDGSFTAHWDFVDRVFAPETRAYGYQLVVNLNSLLTILLPCVVLYAVWYRDRSAGLFGLTGRGVDLRPYAGLLLFMVPLIGWASFQADFLRNYPTYERNEAHVAWGVGAAVPALVYELAYGWDFVATELVFRGLLVIGLASVMGRRAVLPMVVTYAFLHFGKPLGETIGSVFGGYILGVIALSTRNIWGGVAIHLGVAWLMELAAFLQIGLRR